LPEVEVTSQKFGQGPGGLAGRDQLESSTFVGFVCENPNGDGSKPISINFNGMNIHLPAVLVH